MLRMDMLLNPGSPPPSPVREAIVDDEPKVFQPTMPTFPRKDVLVEHLRASLLPSELDQRSNQEEDDESNRQDVVEPASKRLKRGLPGVRVLLESIDNQRDDPADDRNSIFSGHAFWGQVPSLNQSVSPSDVAQCAVVPTVAFAVSDVKPIKPKKTKTPRTSFMSELSSALAVPSMVLPQPQTSESSEEVEPSEAGDSTNGTGKKKKITICKEEGCRSQALSKQLCMKHGGGPRCSIDGCNNGAKLKNLCFQHGGSTICLAPGCSSKSKRFGYCWSHGGGRICGEEGCSKVSAQGGMCWAHGGGNRCKLPGCTKRSYKQHDYYCKRHAEQCADY